MKRAVLVSMLVSMLVLTLFGLLAEKSTVFSWFSPRGGVFTLGLSLLVANAGVWLSLQQDRTKADRLQLALAAWIWLLMQFGAMIYLLATL